MPDPLPDDVKQRAEEKIKKEYPYLSLPDPGTVWPANGKVFVYVLDQNNHGLWLEV